MHLYLHIPFCHRICPYCSFYKHTPSNTNLETFIDSLLTEARCSKRRLNTERISTLYIGGGTPSMLSPTHLDKLINGLRNTYDLTQLEEFTLEANPATHTKRKAQQFVDLGVTRISLGIQSFDDATLKTLGRTHSRQEALDTFTLLREVGIPEINIDLMFSIPKQSLESWQDTLDTALSLEPNHISAYNLTYEEDTEYFEKFQQGSYEDIPERNAEMFTLAHDTLTAAGFEHYETSNYAKNGSKSTHNCSYWLGDDYLGLGPSAVSTISKTGLPEAAATRWKNLPDTAGYIQQIKHVGHAQTEIEHLSAEDLHLERLALMLRTTTGAPLSLLTRSELGAADHLIDDQLAIIQNDHLRLTKKGALLVDSITEYLILHPTEDS